jgi:hypothetical protein
MILPYTRLPAHHPRTPPKATRFPRRVAFLFWLARQASVG